MAELSPRLMLERIADACAQSPIVSAYAIRILDPDVLNLRVHLVDDSFIEVFFNAATDKTSFALIAQNKRIYGKDNAKMGWHLHPLDNPKAHRLCAPVSFETFLAEVETLYFSSSE